MNQKTTSNSPIEKNLARLFKSGKLDEMRAEVVALESEILALQSKTIALQTQINGQFSQLVVLNSQLANQIGLVANQIGSVANQIGLLANEVNGISNRTLVQGDQIQKLEQSAGANVYATAVLAAGYLARAKSPGGVAEAAVALCGPKVVDIESSLKLLQSSFPKVFPQWQQLFENDTVSYEQNLDASASVWGHRYAQLFGGYVAVFGSGRTLDVGCGIVGKPSYLSSVPSNRLAGLEPRPQKSEPGFLVARGFNEFIPWDDASFETVISGTSLDHVISLEKSLSEVARVLTPNGRYLVWLASIPGSPAYAPESPEFVPRDQFHLFHFDRKWIEPVFEKYFDFEDVTIIPQVGFDHVFYCLTTKGR